MAAKRWYLIFVLMLMPVITCGCTTKVPPAPSGDAPPPAAATGEPTLPAGYVIVDRLTGDVTGSGKPVDIFLTGRRPSANSAFTDDLGIVIPDGADRQAVTVKLPNVGGYDAKIFLGDFNGDKVNDLLVTIPTGGSGGYIEHRIISFTGAPQIIFGMEENKGIKATVLFRDGFKCQLSEAVTGRQTTIDLSNKKDTYIESKVYDADGKLLRPVSGWVNPFGELTPVDIGRDGVYELRGQQRVAGMYNADTVANIYSLWKYENGKWAAKQIEVATLLLGYNDLQLLQ